MKVGDLVVATLHTNTTMMGLITAVNVDPLANRIDSMFPYHVCFNDGSFNDWFGVNTLELVSESR